MNKLILTQPIPINPLDIQILSRSHGKELFLTFAVLTMMQPLAPLHPDRREQVISLILLGINSEFINSLNLEILEEKARKELFEFLDIYNVKHIQFHLLESHLHWQTIWQYPDDLKYQLCETREFRIALRLGCLLKKALPTVEMIDQFMNKVEDPT